MSTTFSSKNFTRIVNHLARKDPELDLIIRKHSYPPMWTRPNTFATLIHIILEQQVSLASAKAALLKLKEYIGVITPQKLLQLTDAELRACYFSRQKTIYARELATTLVEKKLQLKKMALWKDDEIRHELKKIKGIGDWTVDVYLLFVLQRMDVFPTGDLAMMNTIKHLKHLPKQTTKEEIIALAESWRPYRSVAAYLLWHYYIQSGGIRV